MFGAPTTIEIGASAEERAVAHLRSRGYRILERNVRFKCGELDVVAVDGRTLCFVEVRSRASLLYGHPAESVTRRKQERVSRAAAVYLQRRGLGGRMPYRGVRFDVVTVAGAVIEVFQDAWRT